MSKFKSLGDKLFIFRKNKLMSQKQIADKIGVSQPAYAKAERGETNPTNYIEKVADAFNIDKTEIENASNGQTINNYGHIEVGIQNQYNLESLNITEMKDVLQKLLVSLDKLSK